MTRLKCKYLHDTGFRDGQSWRDGEVLQFVYASHKTAYGVVLPENTKRPILVDLIDLQIDPRTPQENASE